MTPTQIKREVISKLLKPEVLKIRTVWGREMKIMNALWLLYSNEKFWINYELGFKLNSLAWFLTEEGKLKLSSDFTIFNYQPSPIENIELNIIDTASKSNYNTPLPKPKTISSFLKT